MALGRALGKNGLAVQAKRLNARSVETIKEPGRHADGGNLYLNVTPSGSRSWVFLYKVNGRQREMGLGPLRDVGLARARELASQHRQALLSGADPLQQRRVAVVKPTFGSFAEELIETMRSGWRSPKHLLEWRRTITVDVKALAATPIDQIGTEDVLRVLRPIWTTKPETASRARGRVETILHAATARGLRSGDNPAAWTGHLKALLPPARPKGSRGQYAAMPIDDVPAFMSELRVVPTVSARALEFAILTAARSGEVFGATWQEIDIERRVWIVPPGRMKATREHRVPLSERALEILREMLAIRRGDIVFCGTRTGSVLANTAMTRTLGTLRSDLTPHGFRSSFRDWASERTSFPAEVAEMALAHTISNKVEAAYRRGDLFSKRLALMNAWGGFCASADDGSKVVTLSTRQPVTA